MMPPNEISTTPFPAHHLPPFGDEVQALRRSDTRERPVRSADAETLEHEPPQNAGREATL